VLTSRSLSETELGDVLKNRGFLRLDPALEAPG